MTHRLFLVILKYIAPISQVDQYIVPHREYLDLHYKSGRFLASGPQVPRTGGAIIAQAQDKAEIDAIIQQDPFNVEKIAEYEIVEFDVVKSSKILDSFWI